MLPLTKPLERSEGLFGLYWFSSAWAFHGCDSGFQTLTEILLGNANRDPNEGFTRDPNRELSSHVIEKGTWRWF